MKRAPGGSKWPNPKLVEGYDVGHVSRGTSFFNRDDNRRSNTLLTEGFDNHDDAMPHEEYVAWQRSCLSEIMRLLSPGGAIFYNHKWRVQGGLLQDRHDILEGFPVRQIIIWQRSGGVNFNLGYFLPTYEVIYLIALPDFRLKIEAVRWGDVWKIHQDEGNPHPAPFPVAVAQRCISATTAGVILDPFLGSGTTAVAAMRAGRDWVGIEQSERYVRQTHDRLAAERMQPALL